MGRAGGLREDFSQRDEAARRVGRVGGLREGFSQRDEAARGVGRAGGLREDFPQRPKATRYVGRAGGLREDFYQRLEATTHLCCFIQFASFFRLQELYTIGFLVVHLSLICKVIVLSPTERVEQCLENIFTIMPYT